MSVTFSHAPNDWSRERATDIARQEEIELTDDHWELINALQEYFERNEGKITIRKLHDALDECFHSKGGMKYLYSLLPAGPVAQGCRLAGLHIPPGAIDKSFGSVY